MNTAQHLRLHLHQDEAAVKVKEFHEYKEPVEQHQNSESLDDFASWEREDGRSQ